MEPQNHIDIHYETVAYFVVNYLKLHNSQNHELKKYILNILSKGFKNIFVSMKFPTSGQTNF